MSKPKLNLDDHLAEVWDAALKMAPAFRDKFDFTDRGDPTRGGNSHHEQLAELAWASAEALVRKYHEKVDEASERAAKMEHVETATPATEAKPKKGAVTHANA